jgi:hypothetical protein
MKVAVKILRIVSIVILSLFLVLFILSLILQNRVGEMVLKSLNSSLQTKIETGSYSLSLVRKFPKATVELKNFYVHSSAGFDKKAFRDINTDTLLKARSAFVELRMLDLLRGVYTFTRVGIKSGDLNLFTDAAGNYNYNISSGSEGSKQDIFLNFNRINISDLKFVYNDRRPDLIIAGKFLNGSFKSRIRNENINFEGTSDTRIDFFGLKDISLKHSLPVNIQVGLTRNEKGVFFRKSILRIENWDFILNGFVASDNYIELGITSDNIDLSRLGNILPEKQKRTFAPFDPSGSLKFDCQIKGKPTKTEDPLYALTWSLKDARIKNKRTGLKLDKLSLDGSYTNGVLRKPETSSFSISNFTTRLGTSDYSGSLSVTNLDDPYAEMKFKGKLLPSELREFLNLNNISKAGGSVDLDLKFSGKPVIKTKFKPSDIFNLNSNSRLVFNSVNLKVDNRNVDINGAEGVVTLNGLVTATENMKLFLNNHKVAVSGSLMNFPGWLTGNAVNLTGTLSVITSCLEPESFMTKAEGEGTEDGKGEKKSSIDFPDDVIIDINCSIDTINYKTFKARNITGTLSIRPEMLNLRNVSFSSQKGRISGNGVIVQNRNRSFMGKGSFSVTEVDVNEAFVTFNNFGQNFLKAENLAGSLSGAITLLLPADSLLNPDVRAISAEGKYSITNGSLINFDPVKALSRFISLSELEDIKFDKLENDFFIRNNVFYVPQMNINSSAVSLTVNGKHSFDNEYEYHVKMLLSEILSRKAKRNRSISDEIGEVEDDGLGRTSIYLLLKGKGENVDVSYDIKAQGNQIRENIKKEKENLKAIFNEEYGLYKDGTAPAGKQGTKPRFRIKWDGSSDSTAVKKEPEEERKETFLDRLFKKN